MPTAHELSVRLRTVAGREVIHLQAIEDSEASARPASGWSRKEELGHLVDSAANNHARFVRAALESPYRGPGYDQNAWVRVHAYHDLPWSDLVGFWHGYNLLLAHLVEQVPESSLATEVYIGAKGPLTLGFVIDDYILHMQHHLDHILRREAVTRYPRENS